MASFRRAPRRHPSGLIALAAVVAAFAAAPKAQAQFPTFDFVYWRGGDATNWDDRSWQNITGAYVDPAWQYTTLYFGSRQGYTIPDNDGYVYNDVEYDLKMKGMYFFNQNWVVDGKSLRMLDSDAFISLQSPNMSVTVNAAIRLDGAFGVEPHFSLNVPSTSTATINGEITGVGSLYKSGQGTAVLHGFHNYTEGTYLDAGRLIDYAPHGNYRTNGTLEFHIDNDQTSIGDIRGAGAVVKSGHGDLLFSGGFKDYTGATVVNDGRLIVDAPSSSSSYTINEGGLLEFNTAAARTYANRVGGAGLFLKNGAGTLTLSNPNNDLGGVFVAQGRLIEVDPNDAGRFVQGALQFNVGSNRIYRGSIDGGGSFTKDGAGTLTLAGNHTYSGGTTVLNGRLIDLDPKYSYQVYGALEFRTTGDRTFSDLISGNGSFTKSGDGILTLSRANGYAGGTTVNGGRLIDRNPHGDYVTNTALEFDLASDVYDNDTRRISGTGSFTKSGLGSYYMGSRNAYAGATIVSQGTLIGTGVNVLPTSTALTVNAGATYLTTFGNDQTVGSLSGAGSVRVQGVLTVSGAASTTFSGAYTGSGSLVKGGDSTLTLSGTNGYTGGTTVTGGRLIDANPHGGYVTNATLEFAKAGDYAYATAITGTGSFTKSGAGTLTLSGVNTYAGGTTVSAGRLIDLNPHGDYVTNAVLEFAKAGDSTYDRIIDGTGTFVKSGAGTLAFAGSIKDLVKTQIAGGTLKVTGGELRGDVAGAAGTTLQFDRSGGTYSGAFSGVGALLKTGGGTLTLAKAPANSGGVRASAGTLAINGAGAFGGGLTVDSGATFRNDSSGTLTVGGRSLNGGAVTTLGGSTTVFSGLVSGAGNFTDRGTVRFDGGYGPGNSPASVKFDGNMVLGLTNVLTMELGGTTLGTGYDHLNVLGTATLGGALNVSYLNGFSASSGQSFDLFDLKSSNGAFASISLPTLGNGLRWNTSSLYLNGQVSVQAVPEPASLAVLGLGGLGLLRRRRK